MTQIQFKLIIYLCSYTWSQVTVSVSFPCADAISAMTSKFRYKRNIWYLSTLSIWESTVALFNIHGDWFQSNCKCMIGWIWHKNSLQRDIKFSSKIELCNCVWSCGLFLSRKIEKHWKNWNRDLCQFLMRGFYTYNSL